MKRRAVTPGVLLVNKPTGPTSRDVVNRVMRCLGTRRVGHAGTLDPFAEGLVIVAWDRATGLVPYLQEHVKTYEAVVEFGKVTDTQDRTGVVLRRDDPSGLTPAAIETALAGFRGPVLQVPPMFSALKQEGRRLHELAREGKVVEREPRRRHVHRFDLVEWDGPRGRFLVTCSAGTYVRTLAHDLGERLGPGACVERLVRTVVGPHTLEGTVPYDLLDTLSPEALQERSLTPADALPDWPAVQLHDSAEIRAVRCGSWGDPSGRVSASGGHRILDPSGNLLALVEGGPPVRFLRVLAGEGAEA